MVGGGEVVTLEPEHRHWQLTGAGFHPDLHLDSAQSCMATTVVPGDSSNLVLILTSNTPPSPPGPQPSFSRFYWEVGLQELLKVMQVKLLLLALMLKSGVFCRGVKRGDQFFSKRIA